MAHRKAVHKEKHSKIVVSKFGEVKAEEIDYIVGVMEECYGRLTPHEVALVDLYVFERSSSVDAFMAKEYEEVGVASASFDELFFAMHDAWRGTSRIILCLERMKKLPKLVQVGGIRHEVGHSVLHGSLRYYLLPLPPALLGLANRFDISSQYATNLLYLISIAVKDYEVSRLLYERGYVEDQIAYAKHLLTVTESDTLSWEMSRGKPLAEILCLISYLKAAGCAAPFLFDKTYGEEMKRRVAESFSFLPTGYSAPLVSTILEGFSSLGADTLSNIDQMACLIEEKIVNPLLLR
ncbi:MAG: hypothetical protein ACE5OW_04085 [Candidatus Bathyarchaeia archaeon]